jgi:hypothetical protein
MRKVAWAALLAMLSYPSLAQRPSQAQINAVRQNCRSDYPTVCSGVPTGGSEALQCLERNARTVSPLCQEALAALEGAAAGSHAGAAPPSPAAPPASAMSRRQQMAMLRSSCRDDYHAFCSGVQLGGGRGLDCLRDHGPQLSTSCRSALESVTP